MPNGKRADSDARTLVFKIRISGGALPRKRRSFAMCAL
jgi:hypothetical protein